MKHLILVLLTFYSVGLMSQNVERIVINGKAIVTIENKEGIAVYNTSSNQGTTTDKEGEFKLEVALNDVIEFSSLLFKDFSVKVSEDVIKSKQLTVILVQEINKLDEVVLLPFDLTGNLNADLENVRTYNVSLDEVYFGLDHVTDFEFSADYKTQVDNVAFNEYNPSVENMLNVVNLAGFLIKQVSSVDGDTEQNSIDVVSKTPFKKTLDKYSYNFIHTNFNIPIDKVEDFLSYMENTGIEHALFEKDKELQLLERINELSKSFIKESGATSDD